MKCGQRAVSIVKKKAHKSPGASMTRPTNLVGRAVPNFFKGPTQPTLMLFSGCAPKKAHQFFLGPHA